MFVPLRSGGVVLSTRQQGTPSNCHVFGPLISREIGLASDFSAEPQLLPPKKRTPPSPNFPHPQNKKENGETFSPPSPAPPQVGESAHLTPAAPGGSAPESKPSNAAGGGGGEEVPGEKRGGLVGGRGGGGWPGRGEEGIGRGRGGRELEEQGGKGGGADVGGDENQAGNEFC